MGGKYIFQRAMLFAGLAHQNASRFFQYLGVNNSGSIPKVRYSGFAFDNRLHRFSITLRAQGLGVNPSVETIELAHPVDQYKDPANPFATAFRCLFVPDIDVSPGLKNVTVAPMAVFGAGAFVAMCRSNSSGGRYSNAECRRHRL